MPIDEFHRNFLEAAENWERFRLAVGLDRVLSQLGGAHFSVLGNRHRDRPISIAFIFRRKLKNQLYFLYIIGLPKNNPVVSHYKFWCRRIWPDVTEHRHDSH